MKRSYEECQALYRAVKTEERSSLADRRAVRLALATTIAAGVHTAATGAAASVVAGAGVGNGAASATVVGAKGLVQLLAGGNFLSGLLVGAVVGTAVSVTAFVVVPTKQPSVGVTLTDMTAPARHTNLVSERKGTAQEIVRSEKALGSTPETMVSLAEDSIVSRPLPAASRPTSTNVSTTSQTAHDDRLLDETQALAKVQDALSRHDPNLAWTLLEQQDRQFPSGQLGEERAAAKVLALCAAGRTTEANEARERFIAMHPQSPLVNRVMTDCDH